MAPVGADQLRAMRGLLDDHAVLNANATRVLLRAAPLVANPIAPVKRRKVEDDILRIVLEEKLERAPLVVLALMSCVYGDEPAQPSGPASRPGAAVLKPNKLHTEQDAYNALADLFALELMLNSQALFPGTGAVLYTRDVGLAAFWTALQPVGLGLTSGTLGKVRTTATFRLDQALFPSLDDKQILALSERLAVAGVANEATQAPGARV